jgi:hypothetical protein
MQGYYSDGTYCYTVGSIGQGVISKTSCTAACVSAGVFSRDPDLTTSRLFKIIINNFRKLR